MNNLRLCTQPQWTKQEAVLVGWPRLQEEWGQAYNSAKEEIAEFVTTLSKYSPVIVVAGDRNSREEVKSELGGCADILEIPLGDIWLRDTAPLIGKNQDDRWVGMLPNFNFWGRKFEMEGDTETAKAICQQFNLKSMSTFYDIKGDIRITDSHKHSNADWSPLVFEGGAIEQNGKDYAIIVKSSLLNSNRNPNLEHKSIELWFEGVFGISNMLWFENGLRNDHTDGHVDNLARFVAFDHVVCQKSSGEDDPNRELFKVVEEKLKESGVKVTTIPSPGLVLDNRGTPLPASHLNFLISNGTIIVPTYEERYSRQAINSLKQLFPSHDVFGLSANNIIQGGGAFHCMTRDIPYGVTK